MSTLRKVDAFASILNRAINNTLRVNSKWTEIYGTSIQGMFHLCKETWWIQIVWIIVTMILGALISILINKIL